ncbi:MAG: hypothetical protein DSY74_01705 [Actinobacteria bacterium]|nr:MAG: hypothetical protein DSY74_01705 [Actinomycetota bacterium]HIE60846.1 hypothetical protein [Microbacterium sp.]|tara:strand:+ start:187 stop:1218 length:1032 start_codon:yes stop_codon:yes gene_type:complete
MRLDNGIGVIDLAGLLWSTPLFSLALAVIIAPIVIAFTRSRVGRKATVEVPSAAVLTPYAPEGRMIAAGAALVILVLAASTAIIDYAVLDQAIRWWRFTLGLIAVTLVLAVVVGLIVTRGTRHPEVPAVSPVRRHWASFSSRTALTVTAVVAVLLVATTLFGGLTSQMDSEGNWRWLALPIVNEAGIDPIRVNYYGWTFGVPVLVALVTALGVAWVALDRSAARPYLRPDSVNAERALRRGTASGIHALVTSAMLFTLAGAWRMIGDAGAVRELAILGDAGGPYDVMWRHADLAVLVGAAAPVLEIVAFVLLINVAVNRILPSVTVAAEYPDRATSQRSAVSS